MKWRYSVPIWLLVGGVFAQDEPIVAVASSEDDGNIARDWQPNLALSALGLECTRRTFASALPPEARIESIARVNRNATYGEGAPRNIAYPVNPTNLPELCAVIVNVTTSPQSFYRFGLFLPTQWNWRFLAVGNGAYAGGINWLDMGSGAQYGFAVVSTDTGHNSSGIDLTWALNNEEKRKDFGFRSIHGSTVLGKKLVKAYYGEKPKFSYYSGCSTGGRQGLKEIQLHPDSFDGVLVGAPAWWGTNLPLWTTKLGIYNLPIGAPNYIPPPLFTALGQEVRRQCDAVDDVNDGIVSSPDTCIFDFNRITCGQPGVNASACLTTAQVQTAKNVYADYVANGIFTFPGMSLSSEDLWIVVMGAPEPSPLGQDYLKYFVFNDPTWTWPQFNDSIVANTAALDPGDLTADDFSIPEFRDRGGKIVMYHGYADGLIATKSSNYFYERVAAAMGGVRSVQSWFRYFLVPGMGHCAGTGVGAPWYIAGGNQAGALGTGVFSVPGFPDAKHDALMALMDWVEKDRAVDSIVATTWVNPMNASSGVLRQRPLCPYPRVARLRPGSDETRAESWSCSAM